MEQNRVNKHDLIREKQNSLEPRKSRETCGELVEKISDRMSKVIHDLKNPLANIHLAAEVILTRFKSSLDPEVEHFMDIIFRSAQRIKLDLDSQVEVINNLKKDFDSIKN